MTGSTTIDIIISLVFIYLLYSLLATLVQEIIATNLSWRAANLEKAIKRMLDDDQPAGEEKKKGVESLSNKFFGSPLIKYLGADKGKKPAYLSARNFSKAIVDILRGNNPKRGEDFSVSIDLNISAGSGDTYSFLQSLWADAHGDIEKFKLSLETWFDDTMERASGWYKKKAQRWLFLIGSCITIIFNVDTIEIIGKLSSNPKLTTQIVMQADNFVKSHPNLNAELENQKENIRKLTTDSASRTVQIQRAEEKNKQLIAMRDTLMAKANSLLNNDIKNLNALLGIGIHKYSFRGANCPEKIGFFILSIMGWLLTALAISLGAPFWFDLLNKMMKLRGSVAISSSDTAEKGKTTDNAKLINPKG